MKNHKRFQPSPRVRLNTALKMNAWGYHKEAMNALLDVIRVTVNPGGRN